MWEDLQATKFEGGIPIFLFRLSVSREKKYPQVGFIPVWKGEIELPMACLGVELPGRLREQLNCRWYCFYVCMKYVDLCEVMCKRAQIGDKLPEPLIDSPNKELIAEN